MTRRTRPTSGRLAPALAALLATSLLASCSSDEPVAGDLVAEAQEDRYRDELAQQRAVARREADLPSRPAGVVGIDGGTESSLTREVSGDYLAAGSPTTVELQANGEDRAFQRLCAGELDLVDSARPISRAEWDACRAVGLDVVQFQVAADAVVVAIKSETDVGGDCLTTVQVQDIYRAGSPVTSWEHVGLDDVPLRVAGPDPDNQAFDFFGRVVLDAPEPSLVNFRSDYAAQDNDQGSRVFVVGHDRDERLALLHGERLRRREDLKSRVTTQWQVVKDAFEEVQAAEAEVAKGVRDQRPPAQQQRDLDRKDRAYAAWGTARAELAAVRRTFEQARRAADTTADAKRRFDATRGHVSYFRFSYYELFEEQLRPFEITLPDGQRDCVFPSQRTIVSGQYPLSQRMLLTTTTRSLERDAVADLLEYYLEHAVEAAQEARLVELPDAQVAQQLRVVRGEVRPTLVAPEDEPATTQAPTAVPTEAPTEESSEAPDGTVAEPPR